jgi:hypothetical protein
MVNDNPGRPQAAQILIRFSDHKHSVRFNGDGGPNNLVSSIYLNRTSGLADAKEIRITIEVVK